MSSSTSVIVGRLRAAGCVFAEDEAAIIEASAQSADELEAMVAARVGGLPLEQVVGWAEFHGRRVVVDPGVFVPRRRSEFLVDIAVALAFPPGGAGTMPPAGHAQPADSRRARSWVASETIVSLTTHDHENKGPALTGEPDLSVISGITGPVIVDLCCGSGALGLAVAVALSEAGNPGRVPGAAELHAADLDPAAVACARRNVEPAGGRVYQGDLFAPLPPRLRGRAGIVICNAPYVPTGEIAFMPSEARDHEARMALDGGADGLAVLRRAAAQAPQWLAPGGTLLVETSARQASSMTDAMTAAGLLAGVHYDEETGATVITGTAPEAPPRGR
jgi:release factor glutamine methyltransferase